LNAKLLQRSNPRDQSRHFSVDTLGRRYIQELKPEHETFINLHTTSACENDLISLSKKLEIFKSFIHALIYTEIVCLDQFCPTQLAY